MFDSYDECPAYLCGAPVLSGFGVVKKLCKVGSIQRHLILDVKQSSVKHFTKRITGHHVVCVWHTRHRIVWRIVCTKAMQRRAFGMGWRHLVGAAAQSGCLLGVRKMQNVHQYMSGRLINIDVWQPVLCTVCVFFRDFAVAWIELLLGF